MLCNACGTRYRRTNSLGPPLSPAERKALLTNKRPAAIACSTEASADEKIGRAEKEPRLVA